MNKLSNFGGFALTRSEMKGVRGGACIIYFDTKGGCGNWPVPFGGSKEDAIDYADRYMSTGGATGYNIQC